jgi:hypothetical protein
LRLWGVGEGVWKVCVCVGGVCVHRCVFAVGLKVRDGGGGGWGVGVDRFRLCPFLAAECWVVCVGARASICSAFRGHLLSLCTLHPLPLLRCPPPSTPARQVWVGTGHP